ncbi:MAG: hypothetical protein KC731_34595 [Myxococcales bacterium]|nr:hypothetical protein [Myxococcales bacterium]
MVSRHRIALSAFGLLSALSLGAACGDDGGTTTGSGGSGGTTSGSGAGGETSTGGSTADGGSATTGGGGSGEGGSGPAVSDGCVTGSGLAEGEHSFMLEGLSRRYMLRLPVGYDNSKPWPLVLALHGNGGSVNTWDVTSGNNDIRGVLENDAILIIAEAIDGQWRDYSMPSSTWPERIEMELRYFEEVLTQARQDLCIYEDAIFSMGFSGGGSFSGVLGCRRTDIRAIAVGGSVIYFDEADCVHTPAAWITIGEQELEPGRVEFRDFFRDRAMCSTTSMPTDPMPCEAYEGCGAETPVHYCQHPDGHIWPAFGSAAMWEFFKPFVP